MTDAAASEVASYTYDALNRRVAKSVGTTTTETVWDDWRAIEDYENGVLKSRRTYGIGLDEMIRMENDLNGDGLLEQGYVPVYDSTGNLVMMTGPDGKPVERYLYTPYGEQKILVDSTPPEIEQVRVNGGEIWVEVSEEVLESELTAAVNQDLLRLVRTDTNAILPVSVSQPVQEGGQARRRLVISPVSAPGYGTQVRLTFEPDSLVNFFLNKPPSAVDYTFGWPASDLIISDTIPPRVELVAVRAGVLEIELSEEADPALAASEILVDGTATTWTLQPDRYTLASDTSLAAGSHALRITTGSMDLVGLGLESEFVVEVTVDSAIPEAVIFRLEESRLIEESALQNSYGFHGLSLDAETDLIYVRNRYFGPGLYRFLSPDPLGFVDGPSQYLFAFNSPPNAGDPLGLAGYFFDGTSNDREEMIHDTNVGKLYDVYLDRKEYVNGVGSELWEKLHGVPFGAGGRERLESMYQKLIKNYNSGDHIIDIFGFSRGAALAREFANMIYERGIPDHGSARMVTRIAPNGDEFGYLVYDRYFERPTIRFMGLFDTVASFGIAGNNINIGYDLSIPPNVSLVRHAIAEDEHRNLFPLSSVKERAGEQNSLRIIERGFPGAHSDVGGGYEDNDMLSRIPLHWMWQEAYHAHVRLAEIDPSVGGLGGPDPLIIHESQPWWDYLIGAQFLQFERQVYYYPRRR